VSLWGSKAVSPASFAAGGEGTKEFWQLPILFCVSGRSLFVRGTSSYPFSDVWRSPKTAAEAQSRARVVSRQSMGGTLCRSPLLSSLLCPCFCRVEVSDIDTRIPSSGGWELGESK
jgi:hypothetical protein